MNIYVGNLDYRVDDEELKDLFKEHGTVNSCKVITDKYTGKSRGFGFVEMESSDEAKEAINSLNGSLVKEKEVVVNEAKPKRSY